MICLSSAGTLAYFRLYLFLKTLHSVPPHSKRQRVPFGLLRWNECETFLFNQSDLRRNDMKIINKSTLKQTYQKYFTLDANCVRKSDDSRMLHFALRIAVCCVLPRYGNLDIRRWKFSFFYLFHILGICFAGNPALLPKAGEYESIMILPQVHLRKPCYALSFL